MQQSQPTGRQIQYVLSRLSKHAAASSTDINQFLFELAESNEASYSSFISAFYGFLREETEVTFKEVIRMLAGVSEDDFSAKLLQAMTQSSPETTIAVALARVLAIPQGLMISLSTIMFPELSPEPISFDETIVSGRTIGDNIREHRLHQGLTQAQLASPRFSISYISAIERGKIRPSLKASVFLARQLNVPFVKLFERIDPDVLLQQPAKLGVATEEVEPDDEE